MVRVSEGKALATRVGLSEGPFLLGAYSEGCLGGLRGSRGEGRTVEHFAYTCYGDFAMTFEGFIKPRHTLRAMNLKTLVSL